MLYIAIGLYISTAHWAEAEGLKAACRILAEETKLKKRARRVVEYVVPVTSRILATVLVALAMGRIVKEG